MPMLLSNARQTPEKIDKRNLEHPATYATTPASKAEPVSTFDALDLTAFAFDSMPNGSCSGNGSCTGVNGSCHGSR